MNKKRRKQIYDIANAINNCKDNLSTIKDEEDDCRYNMPENLQDSDRYKESEDCSDMIDEAIDNLGEAVDILEKI